MLGWRDRCRTSVSRLLRAHVLMAAINARTDATYSGAMGPLAASAASYDITGQASAQSRRSLRSRGRIARTPNTKCSLRPSRAKGANMLWSISQKPARVHDSAILFKRIKRGSSGAGVGIHLGKLVCQLLQQGAHLPAYYLHGCQLGIGMLEGSRSLARAAFDGLRCD